MDLWLFPLDQQRNNPFCHIKMVPYLTDMIAHLDVLTFVYNNKNVVNFYEENKKPCTKRKLHVNIHYLFVVQSILWKHTGVMFLLWTVSQTKKCEFSFSMFFVRFFSPDNLVVYMFDMADRTRVEWIRDS